MYREFPHRLLAWWNEPAVRAAARVVCGTRPAIFVVGYLAVLMFGYAEGRAPLRHFNNELLNLPVRWDAGWYLEIVTHGYHFAPDHADLQQNIVFFPAYPMLMRGVGRLLGGHMTGYVLAGTAISLAAFWGALSVSVRVHEERARRRESAVGALAAGGISVRAVLRRLVH